jgi:hypothetical protein
MMRGVPPVELPASARSKLAEIEAEWMAAEDAARGAVNRINSLPRSNPNLLARLESERDRHADRHRQLGMLRSRLNQWHFELRLPPGVVLEEAPAIRVELKNGEKVGDAIANVRREIADLGQQLGRTKLAPLPKAEQTKLVEEYVVRLFRQGAPSVGIVQDRLRVLWKGDTVMPEDTAALLAWIAPDAFCRAIERELAEVPVRADAMPAGERIRRVEELSAQLLVLERKEEHLIETAAADGVEVLRRPDADPRAVLGLQIVAAAAVAQVA